MKFFVALTAALVSLSQTIASPIEARDALEVRADETCGDPSAAVGFLRAYNELEFDHFYTTKVSEMEDEVSNDGYTSQGITGLVFDTHALSTVPLYRLYSVSTIDHFYTTSAAERNGAAERDGYIYEGIAAYVYPSHTCGSVPLYRAWNAVAGDHFYTTSQGEWQDAINHNGYVSEGIAAYVLSA